jgi:hypothetical protein
VKLNEAPAEADTTRHSLDSERRWVMLTYEDCLGMTDLTQEEVDAISEHEHCPAIIALELGNYLVRTAEGQPRIRKMILDDIAAAETRRDAAHTAKLKLVLRNFCERYPAASPQAGP